MKSLYICATLVVFAHAVGVFWHLLTHTRISTPLAYDLATIYAALVGFLPIVGSALNNAGFPPTMQTLAYDSKFPRSLLPQYLLDPGIGSRV